MLTRGCSFVENADEGDTRRPCVAVRDRNGYPDSVHACGELKLWIDYVNDFVNMPRRSAPRLYVDFAVSNNSLLDLVPSSVFYSPNCPIMWIEDTRCVCVVIERELQRPAWRRSCGG